MHARDRFISSVTHDLRSLLTGVRGNAQLVYWRLQQHPSEGAELAGRLEQLIAITESMSQLIDDLHEVTQMPTTRMALLGGQMIDLVALARTLVEQREGFHGRVAVKPDAAPLNVEGQARRIARMLDILLTNAIQCSPRGGEVALRLSRRQEDVGPAAVVAVSDQGIGIPASDLPYVFDLFYRGANVVERYEGHGVGLTLAKRIAEQHGGRITVESAENVGTLVSVVLPLAGSH